MIFKMLSAIEKVMTVWGTQCYSYDNLGTESLENIVSQLRQSWKRNLTIITFLGTHCHSYDSFGNTSYIYDNSGNTKS